MDWPVDFGPGSQSEATVPATALPSFSLRESDPNKRTNKRNAEAGKRRKEKGKSQREGGRSQSRSQEGKRGLPEKQPSVTQLGHATLPTWGVTKPETTWGVWGHATFESIRAAASDTC